MKSNRSMHLLSSLMTAATITLAFGCAQTETPSTDPATAPIIAATVPIGESAGVPRNTAINATFSEAMDSTTMAGSFRVSAGATDIAGEVSYDDATFTVRLTPSTVLAADTVYTATVSTAAKDSSGQAIAADYTWSFTTGATSDTTAPAVTSVVPSNSATGAPINGSVNAVFSEAMNTATIVAANFTLATGGVAVSGTVSYDGATQTAIFIPTANLANDAVYTATVKSGAKDIAGNAMSADYAWSFTTAAKGLGPNPVLLGAAINYVILAKTAISTVPPSLITGNIGLSPAAESYMTGFSQTKNTGYSTSPQVIGKMYAADMTPPTPSNMTTAILNMQTAYTDAAGRPTPDYTNKGAGEIGGLTLTAGLYNWNTAVTISNDVTISGGANDVWIFQMSGDLTISSAKKVVLSGGAQAKNIFWQVGGGSGAILGSTSHLEGIVLSAKAITFATNATLNGRALAQSRVTLDQTTITAP